ncbi:MAG TPA: tetratricopeptide repeat protein [Verrucomicrobiae bacterium]|nr:tetratricopeptide repeat protein [Verrucomicrobiae bacterium]
MKRFVALLAALFFGAIVAMAQNLDDEYVQIFKLIQEGDSLSNSAPSQALAKYLDAQAALDRLHKGSPDWNTRIVNYRLSYLAEHIAALSAKTSVAPRPATPEKSAGPSMSAPSQPEQPGLSESQAQLNSMQQRLGQLQADNQLLEAKLKEALAMRPAAVDPAELAKAQDRIKTLEKENELLKVSVEKQKPVPAADASALEAARRQLAEAKSQLADQTASLSKVTLEKQALESKVKSLSSDDAALVAARKENEILRKQLGELNASSASAPAKPAENGKQVAGFQAEITRLQSDKETLRVENMALENRLKQLSAATATTSAASSAADAARVAQPDQDRDAPQKRLDAAITKEKSGKKAKGAKAQTLELENELAMARTRLEVFEARAVPYTPEELALLKRPDTKLSEMATQSAKPKKEPPPEAAALVREAQRCFAAKEYDKAEAAYVQILKLDPKNVPSLANLAAIQLEQQHLDAADSNIQKALAEDPQDAYSLYILGILRFRQGKFDDALDALSRSAKLDPQNAEVQNYLGLALSEKGMRVPAETALRKAVQLQPGYAGAHYNLAVVYATEKPPAMELARWHYQKAIASGHPRNPELEKRFETRQ